VVLSHEDLETMSKQKKQIGTERRAPKALESRGRTKTSTEPRILLPRYPLDVGVV
jgi:hypothetical protein